MAYADWSTVSATGATGGRAERDPPGPVRRRRGIASTLPSNGPNFVRDSRCLKKVESMLSKTGV